MEKYRALEQNEVEVLVSQGCSATSWESITIADQLDLSKIRFSDFVSSVSLAVGCEVSYAVIKNSSIGKNSKVKRIGRIIENCEIGNNVVIENVGAVICDGSGNFGLGVDVAVVIESGGRNVLLYPELSAQSAYLQSFCLLPEFKKNFSFIIKNTIDLLDFKKSVISSGATICDVNELLNCCVGENVKVVGANIIKNSTINGFVGAGCIVEDSIVAANGRVGVGCIISKCFVADSAVIDYGFNAENSLFFANSECLRGEGCSVFAAPFTSSHHKATLLLAGLYSYYTAGSGSNFSNHRFKLGPLHQGVLERGGKTGSSSYLIWPSKLAPFTNVIGRHEKVVDTSLFPFSLLLSESGKSLLLPGAVIFTSGFERDKDKWQGRDNRSESSPDIINSLALSPFTVDRIHKAIKVLKGMKIEDNLGQDTSVGVEIPKAFIGKALARYHAAVNFYYGSIIAEVLEAYYDRGVRFSESCMDEKSAGEWCDIAGLITPKGYITDLIDDISEGKLKDYSEMSQVFSELASCYKKYEWEWVLSKIGNIKLESSESEELLEGIIVNWREAAKIRLELVKRDAYKEFTENMSIGYGLLGDVDMDFASVRGEFNQNPLIYKIEQETEDIIARAGRLLNKII